ncbi:CD22 [Mytilus coruscus]|uniref:CD22 n=1 Tax=Mytilus coruscus TaxID=42192 RepID=A0A6J8B2A7_MYTCO|nr:CD22 [Mytilus coruscus]
MSAKIIHVVIVLFSLIGIETISVRIQATPPDALLGQTSLQMRCSYTTVTGEFVTGVDIQAKINGQFRTIATFYTPSVPLNATLTTNGNYLSDRVTLTNPTTSSTDSALIQFSQIVCEDENVYMCQVGYAGSDGSRSAISTVANINVKGYPEQPDSVPSYVPSAGIEEGNNVVFTCTGNVGKPQGKFRWVRYRRNSNGATIQETPYETETTTAVQMPGTCTFNGTSQLTLKMEQIDNNVVVRCQVIYQDEPQGSLYKQTDGINVYYRVRNVQVTKSPTNLSFAEGAGPITLTCTSDGNPDVTNTGYTWYKESKYYVSLGTGPTYVIKKVVITTTHNNGSYIEFLNNSTNIVWKVIRRRGKCKRSLTSRYKPPAFVILARRCSLVTEVTKVPLWKLKCTRSNPNNASPVIGGYDYSTLVPGMNFVNRPLWLTRDIPFKKNFPVVTQDNVVAYGLT